MDRGERFRARAENFLDKAWHQTSLLGRFLTRDTISGLIVFAILLLALNIFAHSWALWQRKRTRALQISQHSCEPAITLSRNSWLLGLDVIRDMFSSYQRGTRNEKLTKMFKEIGPTFRTESTTMARIFTIDPRNLKAVFGGAPDSWGVEPVRLEAFRPLFNEGVLVSDGAAWRHSRTLAESVIDRILRLYSADLSSLDRHIDEMLALLPGNGDVVDLRPIFYQFTMDISTEHIFGESVGAMRTGPSGDFGKDYLDSFLHCLKMAGERDEVPQWKHLLWDRKFAKSCEVVQRYADLNIERAVKLNSSQSNGKDGTGPDTWAWASAKTKRARNHILNVLAASFDTGAILLTNIFFHLSRNPMVYQKLRKEVLSFEGVPDGNSVKTMSYLQAVVNETLRLHGPASFNSRVALRDMVIPTGGGKSGTSPIFVPKGDIVIVCQYALQRQYSIYGDDADHFRPERWDVIKPKHWDFQPFSGGSRVCPGQKLALLQAAYTLFRMVQKISSVENRDLVLEFVEEYHVATGSRNGAQVSITIT